jgi:hypothetical protein
MFHLPTTDGRTIILSRYTEPEADLQLLLKQLKLPDPGIEGSGGQARRSPQGRPIKRELSDGTGRHPGAVAKKRIAFRRSAVRGTCQPSQTA